MFTTYCSHLGSKSSRMACVDVEDDAAPDRAEAGGSKFSLLDKLQQKHAEDGGPAESSTGGTPEVGIDFKIPI